MMVLVIGMASSTFALDTVVSSSAGSAKLGQGIVVLSPLPCQVFQRRTRTDGRIIVSGRVISPCDKLQVRITGVSIKGELSGKWRNIPVASATNGFTEEIDTRAGGWYKVEFQALKSDNVVASASVDKVGIGEVFVGAGQSNSTNCAQTRTNETSGMVSSFSGSEWQLANDPQPGAHDKSDGGSFWPAFGDAMYERYHVPIGVAVTGHGGTSVNEWQPDGVLFQWTTTRIQQLGKMGFRAVLWHQGEADDYMAPMEYAAKLTNVVKASKVAAGWEFPWFIAQASYLNPKDVSFPGIRSAQQSLWKDGIVLQGPDTDTLVGDCRDYDGEGIHLSPKGLNAHGKMWADKVGIYLDSIIK